MFALRFFAEGAEGPNTELLWLLGILLGFFALAVIVGWVVSARKLKQVLVEVEAVSSSSKKTVSGELIKIEGIGPKVVKILARAGIETFEDLAEADVANVQKVLDKAGLQMMDPEGWIDQAKLAANGDWAGFEKLQTKLKGGRKK